MNKQITNKAASIFRQLAKKYGATETLISIQESPFRAGEQALYLDGDIVDLYWNNDGFGWEFQNAITGAMDEAGIFIEPYTSTIFDVYNKD